MYCSMACRDWSSLWEKKKYSLRILGAAEVETPVINTDFFPTIVDLVGIEDVAPDYPDGVSLLPLLKGQGEIEKRALYWHFPQYSNHGQQSPGGAILFDGYKLLEYFEKGTVQLFDLKNDLEEKYDVSKSHPEKARLLLEMLHEWRIDVDAKMPVANPDFDNTYKDRWDLYNQ